MRPIRFVVLALTIAALAVTTLPDAHATSMVGCPQICLTGGLVKTVSSSSVAVSGVKNASAASDHHDYFFTWTVVDLTVLPPVTRTLPMSIGADGTTTEGVFEGSGTLFIDFGRVVAPVTVIDDGQTVHADAATTGGFAFHLVVNKATGTGEAALQDNENPSWGGCDCD